MGGGQMQLVAYGVQDIYLTGNPQITFFKVVYHRHTNFSMETIEQVIDGTVGFGNSVSSTISRNGDLVSSVYIRYVPYDLLNTDEAFEHAPGANPSTQSEFQHYKLYPRFSTGLLNEIQIEIGGQEIDRHYAHWLSVREDLFEKNNIGTIPAALINNLPSHGGNVICHSNITNHFGIYPPTKFQKLTGNIITDDGTAYRAFGRNDFFIPLHFWFCRNPGLALPLIALQYHEVKINITLSNANILGAIDNSPIKSEPDFSKFKLFADYIYLDTDERRRFAQVSHEYLIEQLQFQELHNDTILNLNFNHPVKELIWYGVPKNHQFGHWASYEIAKDMDGDNGDELWSKLTTQQKLYGGLGHNDNNYTGDESEFNITLKLNGQERFSPQGISYFTRKQIYDHHTGSGSIFDKDAICVYSFALNPEEHQPSGTCNFSRIDNAELVFSKLPSFEYTAEGTYNFVKLDHIRVYAINYNILRIMSGMGGLVYSN